MSRDENGPRRPDAHAADPAEVRILYRPERDGEPDPGEVVWTWVPYEDDPTQGKDRPVVVIGVAGPQLAVVPLSSRDHEDRPDRDDWIEVGRGSWDRDGRVSHANVDRLLRVRPADVRREGGVLDRERFVRLVEAVAAFHDVIGLPDQD